MYCPQNLQNLLSIELLFPQFWQTIIGELCTARAQMFKRILLYKIAQGKLEPDVFASSDRRIHAFDEFDRSIPIIGSNGRCRAAQDRINERAIFLHVAPFFFFFDHVKRQCFEIRVHASRIQQSFHFFSDDRSVMAKRFDPLKRKVPACIR